MDSTYTQGIVKIMIFRPKNKGLTYIPGQLVHWEIWYQVESISTMPLCSYVQNTLMLECLPVAFVNLSGLIHLGVRVHFSILLLLIPDDLTCQKDWNPALWWVDV